MQVLTIKDTNMNEQKETKSMPNQFILTAAQKFALLEAKVQRAKQYAKVMSEIDKKLKLA